MYSKNEELCHCDFDDIRKQLLESILAILTNYGYMTDTPEQSVIVSFHNLPNIFIDTSRNKSSFIVSNIIHFLFLRRNQNLQKMFTHLEA